MKRLFIIAAALGFMAAPAALAQDNLILNHVALGLNVGTDGLGATVAMPVGEHFQVRAGYVNGTIFMGSLNPLTSTIDVGLNSNGIDIKTLDLTTSARMNHGNILADYYIGAKSSFHFTAGLYFGTKSFSNIVLTPKDSSGKPAITGSDVANTAIYGITSDTEGNILADLGFGMAVKPYLGIGFGRPVSMKHRVGFNFDLGVLFCGGYHLWSYNYRDDPANPTAVEINEDWFKQINDIPAEVKDYTSYLNTLNGFPIYPVAKLSVFVRLF